MFKKMYSQVSIILSVSMMISLSPIPTYAMELDNSDKEDKNTNNTNNVILEEKKHYSSNRIDILLNDKNNNASTNFVKGNDLFNQEKYSDAFHCYKLSSMDGHSEAAFKVAGMYFHGQGVDTNIKRAHEYFAHAAELGCVEAKNMLSNETIYKKLFAEGNKFYQEENFSEAFKCYEILANKGFYESIFRIAYMYAKGQGVAKSVKKALFEFQQLARQGHSNAQKILKNTSFYNELFLEGQKFYQDANYKEAIDCYQSASNGGNIESKFHMAMMFLDGVGVDQNKEKAFDLLKVAAENKHHEAQRLVGDMCFYGIGTKQNYKKAFKYLTYSAEQEAIPTEKLLEYYTLAANDGYIEAQEFIFSEAESGNVLAQKIMFLLWKNGDIVNLELEDDFENLMLSPGHDPSVLYEMGCICFDSAEEDESIVKEKQKQAYNYYLLAAKQGHVEAQISIGKMYASGIAVEENSVKAFDYFMLAANTAYARAQFLIGYMYENGIGVEINLAKAFEYYILAADQGHVDSQFEVGKMYTTGMGTEQDLAKALEYYILAGNQGHVDVRNLILLIEESGNVEAQYYVAYMYYSGWAGCELDKEIARTYIEKYIASKLKFSDEMIFDFEELLKVLMGIGMDESKCYNILLVLGKIPPMCHERFIGILSSLKNHDAEFFNEIVSTDSKCLSFFNKWQVMVSDIFTPHKNWISRGNK